MVRHAGTYATGMGTTSASFSSNNSSSPTQTKLIKLTSYFTFFLPLVFTTYHQLWSVQYVTFARLGSAMVVNVYKLTLARVHCKMLCARSAIAVYTNLVAVYSRARFAKVFCARTINSSTRPRVKYSSRRTTNANRAIAWVNTHVCAVRFVTVRTM